MQDTFVNPVLLSGLAITEKGKAAILHWSSGVSHLLDCKINIWITLKLYFKLLSSLDSIDTDRGHDYYIDYHQKCFTVMVIVNYQERVDRCMDGWNDGQMDDQ